MDTNEHEEKQRFAFVFIRVHSWISLFFSSWRSWRLGELGADHHAPPLITEALRRKASLRATLPRCELDMRNFYLLTCCAGMKVLAQYETYAPAPSRWRPAKKYGDVRRGC
jgi:hypothetical protein